MTNEEFNKSVQDEINRLVEKGGADYSPTEQETLEQDVVLTLHSVESLLEKVEASPLQYEEHLSLISDIMYRAAEMKAVVSRAMSVAAYEEMNELSMTAKLNIAGL